MHLLSPPLSWQADGAQRLFIYKGVCVKQAFVDNVLFIDFILS